VAPFSFSVLPAWARVALADLNLFYASHRTVKLDWQLKLDTLHPVTVNYYLI
jgi:hypothetical protein